MKRAYTIALISMVGGLLVHMMVLLVIQIDVPLSKRPPAAGADVKFIGSLGKASSDAVVEQAALQDSAPLFMPTKWNSASNLSDVASLQSATRIFEPFPPQIALVGTRPARPSSRAGTSVGEPVRLPEGSAFYLARFGREAPRAPGPVSPGPTVRVARIKSNPRGLDEKQELPANLVTTAPQSLWNPVKMFLQLQNGVPVGLPLLSQSSGFADWDATLQQYFTRLEFYRRLNDGYYQIWVYP